MSAPNLPDPEITVADDGTPRSGVSGDVYFSADGGVAETRHVFLEGIGAPDIWQGRDRFRIGELGFGTGLNFLLTWRDWARTAPATATLDYVAVEGYPIVGETLRDVLSAVSEVTDEAAALLAAWPPRVGGVHRLAFMGGRVRLTLLFGDAASMLPGLNGQLDAWFLDGFAPAKNPSMWTAEILSEVRRTAAPGCRVATFTAAGDVRRGLAALGFQVEKRAGFGRKRDCVAAELTESAAAEAVLMPGARVAVVGAGIAGCCLARALTRRGVEVTLIDRAPEPGAEASGNPAALIAPRLPRERVPMGRIMASAYLHAVRFYDTLAAEGAAVWHGARGAFVMARSDDEDERQQRALAAFAWPAAVMRRIDAAEASALAGVEAPNGGLWFPGAGTLNPSGITRHLAAGVRYRQADISDLDGLSEFDAAFVAAGTGVMDLMGAQGWPLRANRGQLAYLPDTGEGPTVPVTFGGYLSPAVPLGDGRTGRVLGATYARRDEVPDADWRRRRAEDERSMLKTLRDHLPALSSGTPIGGRTALRTTIRDYLPLAGRVDARTWVLGGLGSRGFMSAPLMADLIADQATGTPLPLEADLVRAVDPARFG